MRAEEIRRVEQAALRQTERARAELEARDAQLQAMRAEMARLQEVAQEAVESQFCCICEERRKNITLGCGHQLCEQCAGHVDTCAECRCPITSRTKTF